MAFTVSSQSYGGLPSQPASRSKRSKPSSSQSQVLQPAASITVVASPRVAASFEPPSGSTSGFFGPPSVAESPSASLPPPSATLPSGSVGSFEKVTSGNVQAANAPSVATTNSPP